MVNSKKMSKSSVAVMVLAILLVLSMILGLTGAWYTANAAGKGEQSGSVSMRDQWLTLSLAADEGAIEAYRADKTTPVELDEVMPGDYLKADSTTFTVTATKTVEAGENVSAWVFLLDASGKYVEGQSITTGTPVTFASIEIGVTDADNYLGDKDGEGYYQVSTGIGAEDAGEEIATFSIGNYSVVAIQAENLDSLEAAATALNIQAAA